MTDPSASGVRQVRVEFLAEEDRLLLRIAAGGEELPMWLTRRCVRLLRRALDEAMAAAPRVVLQATPESRAAVLAHECGQVLAHSDFSTPYAGPSGALLSREGAAPGPAARRAVFLVTRIEARRTPHDGVLEFVFLPVAGAGVNLRMDADFPYVLARMLDEAAIRAEWNLDPPAPALAPELAASETSSARCVLH